MTPLVRADTDGAVATLTLDSPANRNALSARLMAELGAGLAAAMADPAVRVVVLSHTGRAFCSGADLLEARATDAAAQPATAMPALLAALWEAPKPVVARVAGPARAGGLGLLAACDVAVCALDVTFAFTEVRIGVVPAVISATVLSRLAPRAAQELFLTGEVFAGERAAAIGLVTAAVPAGQLDDEVGRYVGMLLRGAPAAVAATKALLRRRPVPSPGDLSELSALSARHFMSAEGREGMAAFAAKRDPSWLTGEPDQGSAPGIMER